MKEIRIGVLQPRLIYDITLWHPYSGAIKTNLMEIRLFSHQEDVFVLRVNRRSLIFWLGVLHQMHQMAKS